MTQMIHEVWENLGSSSRSSCYFAFTHLHEDNLLVTSHKRIISSIFELVGDPIQIWGVKYEEQVKIWEQWFTRIWKNHDKRSSGALESAFLEVSDAVSESLLSES